VTEQPETTVSPRRAWIRQAFDDMAEVEWHLTFVGYAFASMLGAMFVGDGTVGADDLFMGMPLALLVGWFTRREHGTTAFVLGTAALTLGFVAGAGILVID
jgi:hypothetical protein